MRRLLVALAVLVPPLAGAVPASAAGPADLLPATIGNYAGVLDCDSGSCWGSLDLTGRFAAGQSGSIQTTARLVWTGRDDVVAWYGTITSPRFDGTCRIARERISVPGAGHQLAYSVDCGTVVDGGVDGGGINFWFDAVPNLDVTDTDPHRTGTFFQSPELVALWPL